MEEEIKQELENMKEAIRSLMRINKILTIGFGSAIICIAIAGILLGASI